MNFSSLISWGILINFFVFCFIFSFNTVEADRIRIIHRRSKTPPKLYAPSIYAKKYSYNNPITNFSKQGKFGKSKFSSRKTGKGFRNYANDYRNWSPDNRFNNAINKPRVDNVNRNYQKKRKESLFVVRDGSFNNKQKQRIRPQRKNPLQRPLPPRQNNDFDEDYYFPEEAVRTETKFEYETNFQRPKKRRRNPSESEKVIKGHETKFPIFNEKSKYQFKQKNRDSPISYSTFVQHPNNDSEDIEEEEQPQYVQTVKNKKKKFKKKSNLKKKIKEEEYYSPERDEESDGYQAVVFKEYESSGKRIKKPSEKPIREEEDYFYDKSPYIKPQTVSYVPHNVGLSAAPENYNTYKENLRPQGTSNFNPSFSRPWHTVVETTARPLIQQPQNGPLSTQYTSNQYNFQNGYQSPNVQQIQTFSSAQQGSFYSQPDNTHGIISTSNPPPNYNYNYNQNNGQISSISNQHSSSFPKSVYSSPSSPAFQQPSNLYQSSVTIDKTVPIYENTQTYYNYNSPYVQTHSSKNQEKTHVYNHPISSQSSPNYVTQIPLISPQRVDDDNDFVKKHQNLYYEGLSGVPIQGDGYGSHSGKKDYDIGYGDFQFDENPSS